MTQHPPSDHFRDKSVVEHLREARTRGAMAVQEVHGAEMPGHVAAGADAAKETSILLLVLWVIMFFFPSANNLLFSLIVCWGFAIWKTGRSALLGWSRIERLHRLIEQERWEIEHHREQERSELAEIYEAKGFSGKLLEDVLDVLMADDNRLLKVMLEEELGLTLQAFEHPLKQSIGALCGVLGASTLCLVGMFLSPLMGLPLCASITLIISTLLATKLERNLFFHTVIWHLALAALVAGSVYFISLLFTG